LLVRGRKAVQLKAGETARRRPDLAHRVDFDRREPELANQLDRLEEVVAGDSGVGAQRGSVERRGREARGGETAEDRAKESPSIHTLTLTPWGAGDLGSHPNMQDSGAAARAKCLSPWRRVCGLSAGSRSARAVDA